MASNHEDVELIRRALGDPASEGNGRAGRKSDVRAMRILFERLKPVLYARVRMQLLRLNRPRIGPNDCDDLFQMVWNALLKDDGKKLREYDPSRSSLECFVGLITKHEVLNCLEYETRDVRNVDRTSSDDGSFLEQVMTDRGNPEENVEASEWAEQLWAYLSERLPERGRLVFRYCFTDGRSASETAQILGVNDQVVYNWVFKVRELARSFFEPDPTRPSGPHAPVRRSDSHSTLR